MNTMIETILSSVCDATIVAVPILTFVGGLGYMIRRGM